jgi:hypothetical protein
LAAGALWWFLELLEIRCIARPAPGWNPLPGHVAPAVIITVVTLIACLPTFNIYFLTDDFGYLHMFRDLSISQFLRLFHTDIAEVLWSEPRQELRPLYSLYYMGSYRLWGLHPLGWHLTGTLLHIIVSFLVFLIAKSLAPGQSWRAGFAAMFYAVQPPHSQTISLVHCCIAENFPILLYLTSFLFFIRFRSTGLLRYLAISLLAFAGCLLTKESALTLPIMLVCYDLFRMVAGEEGHSARDSSERSKLWRRLVLPFAPYFTLLLAYLEWRRWALTSYLGEARWGSHMHEAVASPTGFWLHFMHLATHVWELHAFNLQNLLLPYPSVALGLVLGLYLVWALSLLRRRSECRRSVLLVLYFGLVWYSVSNLPLLAVMHVPYHLYLPAVGPCIAAAFLAAPTCRELAREARYSRSLGMVFLVAISAIQLWKQNTEWAHIGEMSARMTAQLASALESVPKGSMVVIWPAENPLMATGWGEVLPFAVQMPFAPTDLYSSLHIVEAPDLSLRPGPPWWEKTRPMLDAELTGPPDGQVEIYLLSWDEQSKTFQQKKRVLSRKPLRACVTESLGGPVESVDSLAEAEENRLVEALAKLVLESN